MDALVGKRFEREPMVMLVSVPTHLVSCLKQEINSLYPFKEPGWHEPGRMNLVLLLKTEQGITLSSPQKTAGIHIMEGYEHRTFS